MIIFSHRTAVDILKWLRETENLPGNKVAISSAKSRVPWYDLGNQPFACSANVPVSIIVPKRTLCNRSGKAIRRFCSCSNSARIFWKISKNFAVVPPEMVLCQIAKTLGFYGTLLLMLEFCGTYSVKNPDETRYRIQPITSPQKIQKFIDNINVLAVRFEGTKIVKRAVKYCVSGSASPQESNLFMKTALSKRHGGLGISGLQLNKKILLKSNSTAYSVARTVYADMCLENKRLVFEYDSNQFHSSPEKVRQDKARRDALQLSGWTVIVITSDQLSNTTKFTYKMRDVFAQKEMYLSLSTGFQRRQAELFKFLSGI